MTTTGILILITALCTLATALIGLSTSLRNRKTIQQLEIRVDGRLEEFLALTRKSSHAEGVLQGVADEKANPT
jgi:hypothetical protein